MDGSQSDDLDGDSLLFSWTCTSAPNGVATADITAMIDEPGSASTSMSLYLPTGSYSFQLMVDDQGGFDGTDGSNEASIATDSLNLIIENSPATIMMAMAEYPLLNVDNNESTELGILCLLDPDIDISENPIAFTILSAPEGSSAAIGTVSVTLDMMSLSLSGTAVFEPDLAGSYTIRASLTEGSATTWLDFTVRAYSDEEGGVHVIIE